MNKKSIKKKLKKSSPQLRIVAIGLFFSLALGFLTFRIAQIKFVDGAQYEKAALNQQLLLADALEITLRPNRGSILDRNRQSIAVSTTVYKVFIDVRKFVKQDEDKQRKNVEQVYELLGISETQMREYLAYKPGSDELVNDTHYLIIAHDVPRTIAEEIEKANLGDIYLEQDTKRTYVHGSLASNVIGFIRGDAWGLELQYNSYLQGKNGRMFRIYDATNYAITEQEPAVPGYSLVTTLDLTIQQIAKDVAVETGLEFNAENVGVIVMDPNTGEVLAMEQYPSYDLNEPSNIDLINSEMHRERLESLEGEDFLDGLFKLWSNFNIANGFQPGSIFKPIVVAAALEEGIISPDSVYFCGGSRLVTGTENVRNCWYKQGHGNETLTQVLSNSCNVGMMEIIEKLGKLKFYNYRNDFGFGEETDIDLPGEEGMSSPNVMYTLDMLRPVELATSSFGQGFNNTAIQAITAFSAVINGGNLMKPYLVSQVLDEHGNVVEEFKPTVERKVISQETSDYMRKALQAVVDPPGTGKRAYIPGYAIGGKTGTAQEGNYEDGEYAVSFIAYLPVENPQYIAMITIYKPEQYIEGSTSAAPKLKTLLQRIINYKGIMPSESIIGVEGSGSSVLFDLSGMGTKEASVMLNNSGMNYVYVGNGNIVQKTSPQGGVQVTSDSTIFVFLTSDGLTETVKIPDVEGLSKDDAVNMLNSFGFGIKIEVSEASSGNPDENGSGYGADEGIVITQLGQTGTMVEKGTQIKIAVE